MEISNAKEKFSELFNFVKDSVVDVASQELQGKDKQRLVIDKTRKFIMEKIVKPIDFPGFDPIYDKIIDSLLVILLPELIEFVYSLLKKEAVEI